MTEKEAMDSGNSMDVEGWIEIGRRRDKISGQLLFVLIAESRGILRSSSESGERIAKSTAGGKTVRKCVRTSNVAFVVFLVPG